MASTEIKPKDGKFQNTSSKVPWADEHGIGVKIYDGVVLALEILVLYLKMTAAYFYAIYRLFVPPELKSVKGEIILITGAGHGMGREMALRFAKLGGIIVCVDINPSGNQETADLIKEMKKKVYTFQCDVTSQEAVKEMAEKVKRDVGDVTILVNNAGIMPCKPLLDHRDTEIRKMFDVNVLAHLWLLQEFLPAMKKKNHGHIVAMSSMAGKIGLRNLVPYCASKYAVRGLMEALHEELREDPVDYSGIKFTTICPYIIDTGLCKRPKIKFPNLLRIISPQEAADNIVDAVRRNYIEITIPGSLYYLIMIVRALPVNVPIHLKDFLDSGLEPALD